MRWLGRFWRGRGGALRGFPVFALYTRVWSTGSAAEKEGRTIIEGVSID